MLVISRRKGEAVFIRNKDTQEVIEIALLDKEMAYKSKIGIEAPMNYEIIRGEHYQKGGE